MEKYLEIPAEKVNIGDMFIIKENKNVGLVTEINVDEKYTRICWNNYYGNREPGFMKHRFHDAKNNIAFSIINDDPHGYTWLYYPVDRENKT